VFVYFYALDSQHIPRNGDEFPYAHITRLTAGSHHLLPLQSEFADMRNTKPPLLFWQGIATTGWGRNWTLWHLRYPSVIYTLLTAGLVFLLAWKLSRKAETGFVALLTFLAFFTTYRYGRPFLTNPPEVFWLFLPFFILLYREPGSFASAWAIPLLLGLVIGIGLLYKSFALALPVFLALSWWYLRERGYDVRSFLAKDSWKLGMMGVVALGMFSLWFVLDPQPQAIWKEFVLGENVGKFDPNGRSYLSKLFWGGSSIWSLAVSYPLNAGLLAFPVAALFVVHWRHRARLGKAEKQLWILVVTLFVVFCLPSQRSGRYLLEGMPALAVLCALSWERLPRQVFAASVVAAGVIMAGLAYLSIRIVLAAPGSQLYPIAYWVLLTMGMAIVLVALFWPGLTRLCVHATVLLAFLSLAAFLRPFDGPSGTYSSEVQQYVQGKTIWVPTNFKAKEEGYRFLLPGAEVRAYRLEQNPTLAGLTVQYPLFAFRLPMQEEASVDGRIVGQRFDLGSRHTPAQIKEMLRGRIFEHLFLKELIIEGKGHKAEVGSAQK